jgi:hypothetical protein
MSVRGHPHLRRPVADVQHAFNLMLQQRNKTSVYEAGCHSWYLTADGRNTNTWVGYMSEYGRLTRRPNLAHYHQASVAAKASAQSPAA